MNETTYFIVVDFFSGKYKTHSIFEVHMYQSVEQLLFYIFGIHRLCYISLFHFFPPNI